MPKKKSARKKKSPSKIGARGGSAPAASSQKAPKIQLAGDASQLKWVPLSGQAFTIPKEIRAALAKLADAGHDAYLVGGCVRDHLLNLPIKDYDIATSAVPDEIAALFPAALDVGRAFGVMKIPLGKNSLLEIATFREDVDYQDHRHPTSVRFAGPVEDSQRRDFTVNALFYDPVSKRILDAVGGTEDIRAKLIRAIGEPKARFEEDALRILRAIRFSARFRFAIEPRTWTALCANGRLLKKISAERVRDEITGITTGKNPALGVRMLKDSGLLDLLLPETKKLDLRLVEALEKEERGPALGWAALLHEMGGEQLESRMQGIADRFRLSKGDGKTLYHLVRDLPRFNEVFQMRTATLQRWVREPHFGDLLKLYHAQQLATTGNLTAYELSRKLYEEANAQAADSGKLLSGEDLIQLGLRPGPRFSEILKAVEDLALESKLRTKDEALEYVVKHFVG